MLQLTAEGHSGVEIAARLFISPRTVESHRASLMRKLGVHNQKELVRYAVQRRIAGGHPDYWDHATALELAVLARDEAAATESGADALALVREPWEHKSTANNLRLIRESRAANGETLEWADSLERELGLAAGE